MGSDTNMDLEDGASINPHSYPSVIVLEKVLLRYMATADA